jgi:WD40 repeat protein
MWKKIKMSHHTFGLMLLVVVIGGSSLRAGQAYWPTFRLSTGGYSPTTNTLLFAVKYDLEELKGYGLAAYNEKTDSITMLSSPTGTSLFDFAWLPGQAAFVATQSDRMILYREDAPGEGYTGTAIQCPIDFLYTSCSWSPDGKCLAVICLDLNPSNTSSRILGLYDYQEQKFVITKLDIDYRFVVWGYDGLLYATSGDKILAVELKTKKPRVVRTIPLKERLISFYGMFGDRPLFQTYEGIKLGDKMLIELDRPGIKFRVAATKMAVFVSASPTQLVVFDRSGREVDRTNPGKIIRFGSPRDQNTVYALTDSTLLRVSVENETVNIRTVCDLDDARLIVPK